MAVIQRPIQGRLAQRTVRKLSLLFQSITYVLALLALVLLVQRGAESGQRLLDDVRYGVPRSVHALAYVGHGNERSMPTVLQTLNLNGQISVLVIPGGDIKQLQVLEGPYVVGSDGPYVVPYLSLRDLNSDGHVDLVVTVRNEAIVYINDSGKFRTISAEEHATLMDGWNGH